MAPAQQAQHHLATPAATVVPLRDGVGGIEVLMLRRNARGPFGGMWVFPGGQIDSADRIEPADWIEPTDWVDHGGDDIGAARRAALREAKEEASLVLDPDTLVLHSWWVPPPEAPRRFATWFFLAPVGDAPEVVVDGREIHEHRWFPPSEVLDARDRGEIPLAPPTWMTLWWLRKFDETAAALAAGASRPPERFETRTYRDEDGLVACWQGDVAYDSGVINAPGPRRRLRMGALQWRVEVDSA